MKKRLLAMLLASAMVIAVLSGCSGDNNQTQNNDNQNQGNNEQQQTEGLKAIPKDELKIGFLYVGPVGDEGYSYTQDQGRLKMAEALGVETLIVENVPEDSSCETSIRNLIDQGCNVIYATSFGHGEWVERVAKEFPNVYFGHATGYIQDTNVSNYMGRVYEARYLSGIAAGLRTESNQIGYVAAMPIPEVVRGINAFTLGVRSVNPEATVKVTWLNSWVDAPLEKSAAIDLINGGCDVIAQHCDTTGPQQAAQEKGVWCVGYNARTASAAPDAYLTAPLFHWEVFYEQDVKAIMDGTWKSQSYWEGLNAGMVSLDDLTDNCAEGTKEKVEAAQKAIMDGSLYVFEGEIKDNEGNVRVKAGEKMTDDQLTSFDWFVEGVIGSVG